MASEHRRQRGRTDRGAAFPVAPAPAEAPPDYALLLSEIKQHIARERVRVVLASNAAMVMLYWDIGQRILDKQQAQGWGARIIDRLSADLRAAFPDMKGFSPRNLKYMRAFAQAWPERPIVQEALAQLTWYHNIALVEKLGTTEQRLWYARQTLAQGWSRNVLAVQIEARAIERQGQAQNNFPATLPPPDSDLAVQAFKDPYLFDFLGTDAPRRERDLEQGLIAHIQDFLLELGQGFAFVGRQVHLELGGEDFYLDLLFYHLKLRRYVVIELKARPFSAARWRAAGPVHDRGGPPAGPPGRPAHAGAAAGAREEPHPGGVRAERQQPTHQRGGVADATDAATAQRVAGELAEY